MFETRVRSGPFTVLVVCTGNICRSPQAAALLETRIARIEERTTSLPVSQALKEIVVGSAGTGTHPGMVPPSKAIQVSRELGADVSAHSAQPVDDTLLDAADLVLTMEREHRNRVVAQLPSVTRRAFTLLEFARLVTVEGVAKSAWSAPGSVHDRLRAGVASASTMRGMLELSVYDVDDPYGHDLEVYRASGAVVRNAIDSIFHTISATLPKVRR